MKKFPSGFTLIELIIVVTITTLLGVLLSSVLLQTFKGENKVAVISKVKQNGQLVMDNLANQIRTSDKIVCVGGGDPNSDTLVIYKQGVYTRYRFFKPQVASKLNGYIASDTYTADDFPNLSPTPTPDPSDPSGNLNIGCSSSLFTSRTVSLTDKDPINGISIDSDTNKIFSRDYKPGYTDTITIKFKAYAGVSSGSSYDVTVSEGGILLTTTAEARSRR